MFGISPWKLSDEERHQFSRTIAPTLPYITIHDFIQRQQQQSCANLGIYPSKLFCPNLGTGTPLQLKQSGSENRQDIQNSETFTKVCPTSLPTGHVEPFSNQFGGLGRKVFPCPQCRYTTDRRNNLKRHMLTMHQTCSKLLECCGIFFSTKASLREHAMVFHYHGYTCFYCGRRFCRKALLKRHLSVHNGQKDFVCSVCDYATSHKSNLERHRKVHARIDDITEKCGSPSTAEDSCKSTKDMLCDNYINRNDEEEESNEELSVCSDDEEINVHSE